MIAANEMFSGANGNMTQKIAAVLQQSRFFCK
jgi:hypothetical protein